MEVFKSCPACMNLLTKFLFKIWISEEVTVKFVRTTFVMFHKKGSSDDPSMYRCLVMLNHAYKALSQ